MKETNFKEQFNRLAIAYFLFFLGFNAIIPELPSFLRSLGGDDYLGYIISLFALSAMLARPISGKLSDNIGRKPIMMIGTAIGVMVLFLYPSFPILIGFLGLRFAHGLSAGFMPTAAATAVSDIVPEAKIAKYMGYVGMFASTGMAMGPVIGSWVAIEYGVNVLFYMSGVVTLLAFFALFFVKESLPEPKAFELKLLTLKRSDIFDKKVLLPAVIMVLTVLGFGVILTLIPDFSDHLGIKNRGTFFFIFTIFSIGIRFILSNAFDKYPRTFLLKIGSFIMTIALVLLAYVELKWQFYCIAALSGIAGGINSPILFALTIDVADKLNKSRAISTLFISLELGILVGAYTAGAIFEIESQNYRLPILIAGLCSGCAFVILQFWKKN
ncbi:MAG: MFS family permease [Patiriisocius sp.]